MATTHILDEQEKVYNIPAAKKYLKGRFSSGPHRQEDPGAAPGKRQPQGHQGDSGPSGKDVRFVNRQAGSGTRILLDMILREKGIDRCSIQGYDREESTHTATAILVKEGIADMGLAIYPVSRIFDLDFIPLMEEEYDLLVTKEFSETRGSGLSWNSLPRRSSPRGWVRWAATIRRRAGR